MILSNTFLHSNSSSSPKADFDSSLLSLPLSSSEMLQFVSNQVGDFPDLFEDQMASAGSAQNPGATTTTQRPTPQTPEIPQTPAPAAYQTPSSGLAPSQTLSPQSVPLTPPLTPVQTPSPTTVSTAPQQVTRSPPLLQPRPQVVQPIQPQPQPTPQPTIQVSTYPCLGLTSKTQFKSCVRAVSSQIC